MGLEEAVGHSDVGRPVPSRSVFGRADSARGPFHIEGFPNMRPTNRILILLFAIAFSVAAMFAEAARARVTKADEGPVEVMIIRHGEEPDKGPHLSEQGQARAKALVDMFGSPFSQPTSLWAAKSSDNSERSVETLEPLSKSLKIPIDVRFKDDQYKKLAEAILQGPRHAGGNVLICWHRETMTELAAALGVANPPEWKSKDYDRIWRIRYSNGKATLTDEAQGLKLPGFESLGGGQ